MRKCFLFVIGVSCIFSSVSRSLYAQSEGVIHGVVTAKADGSTLPDTAIRLESSSLAEPLRTTTGQDGHFTFQRLIPGQYTLVASHSDFQDERIQFTLKPREIQNISLELSLRGIVQSIEVRENPQSVADTYSPSSTTLQKEAVEELPLGQRNNLPDMIVMAAPGMIRSHDDFVHVRGHEIALNTFINGVSFWENPHSVLSAGLSPDIIQSVNVMTGDFPAEYGNRFGGVVDIVTKSGLSMNNEGSLTLGAGTALRHNAAIEYGGHTEKAGYYLYSSAFESARFLSPNDPRSIHDTGRGTHHFLQLDFTVNPTNSVKVVLMGNGTNFQIPKTSLDDQLRPNDNASERTRAQSAVLSWNHTVSNDMQITTSLYQRWSHMILTPSNDPLAAVASNERTLWTSGLKSDLTRFFGRHTLKVGLDLVLLKPDEKLLWDGQGSDNFSRLLGLAEADLRGPIAFAGRKTGGQASAYVQDSVRLSRGLTANVGLRFDRYSLDRSDPGSHFSPRLNLAYRFAGTGTVLHASYNHFFAPPAVENVLIASAGLTRYLQDFFEPLSPLQPITENQFEVGITHPVTQRLRAGLTGYYRESNNPVHTVVFPDSRIYAYANFDKGKAYGMEIKTDVQLIDRLGLSAYLNYALSRVYLWNPVTAGFVEETHHVEEAGRFLAPMDQTHTLNAGFTYHHRKSGLWGRMTFEYGSGTPTEAEADEGMAMAQPLRVPGHFTQNLTIGMDLPRRQERRRAGLQFNVENLTNNVYKVSQESVFSPGEYFNPRFFSGSMKIHF